MSIMPNPPSSARVKPIVPTVLFWILITLLAVIVWQKLPGQNGSSPSRTISYPDFLQQVDRHNIATATLVLSRTTVEARGNLRETAQEYHATVPRDDASDLMTRLRGQGVSVKVSKSPGWIMMLLYFVPLLIVLHLVNRRLFMMMQRMRAKQTAFRQNPTSIPPSNTPL